MSIPLITVGVLSVAVAAFLPAEIAWSQAYPSKPVRLVLSGSPGTAPDLIARLIAQRLSESLGQQFVVDNRPGGGGIVSAQIAAHSPADGYTVFLTGSGGVTIAPFLAKKRPYDPVRDFAPVTLIAVAPLIVTNHPSLPVNSVKDLIGLAKAKPRQLLFGSTGAGSVQHLTIEKFSRAAGIDVIHVPYKGGAPAVISTVNGEAQLVITAIPPVLPHIRSSRLRALAVTSSQRSSAVPEIPTVAESGLPGFESVTWYGMFVPMRTPPAIIDRLYGEVRKAADSPRVRSVLAQEGLELAADGPRALAEFHRIDIARWQGIIRELRESSVVLE